MKNKRISILLISILSLALLMSGCSSANGKKGDDESNEPESLQLFAMDTSMKLDSYGSGSRKALNDSKREIDRLDKLLSTENATGEVGKINNRKTDTLSKDAGKLMNDSLLLYRNTGGAFDITVYPLVQLWGFVSKKYRVPADREISNILTNSGSNKIQYDEKSRTIKLPSNTMKIDFGGIAKGYLSDRLIRIFKENKVASALISLGGNVVAVGSKPDGSPWRIAIQNPDGSNDHLGVAHVKDKVVITSGGYERFFEKNGTKYHHILDPKTGKPANSGLASVTIVGKNGTVADGLSTALFVMGKDESIGFWRKGLYKFDFILMDTQGRLYISEGLKNKFKSEQNVQVITKQ